MYILKPVKEKEVDSVITQSANYYRHSRLYTEYFDVNDAYDKYIGEYSDSIRLLVSFGHSYGLKGNYLVGVEILKFKEDYPEEFKHYFGPVAHRIVPVCEKENHPVMFVCIAAPAGNQFDRTMYKLINEFVSEYSREYIVYTDCAIEIDFNRFTEYTNGKKVVIAGGEYFRWGKDRV